MCDFQDKVWNMSNPHASSVLSPRWVSLTHRKFRSATGFLYHSQTSEYLKFKKRKYEHQSPHTHNSTEAGGTEAVRHKQYTSDFVFTFHGVCSSPQGCADKVFASYFVAAEEGQVLQGGRRDKGIDCVRGWCCIQESMFLEGMLMSCRRC